MVVLWRVRRAVCRGSWSFDIRSGLVCGSGTFCGLNGLCVGLLLLLLSFLLFDVLCRSGMDSLFFSFQPGVVVACKYVLESESAWFVVASFAGLALFKLLAA